MIWIVIAVASLIFFAIAYKCAQTWETAHVVLATLVFLSTLGFIILSAMTLKTLDASRTRYDNASAELLDAEEEYLQLSKGTFDEALADETEPLESVRALQARMRRVLTGRGRVWTGCETVQVNDETIQLNVLPVVAVVEEDAGFPVDEDENAEPVVAAKHHIGVRTILYAFKEVEVAATEDAADEGEGFADEEAPKPAKLPSYYLGAYQVTQAGDTTVTLKPLMEMSDSQKAHQQDGTWVLYETMPVDDHDVFAVLSRDIFGVVADDNMTTEGRLTTEAEDKIRAYFPKDQFTDELVEQYLRDGTKAQPQSDPEQRIWKKVEFLKAHTMPVDSDQGFRFDQDSKYDDSGLAVSPSLKQGQATEFAVESTHLLDPKTAKDLIDAGICKAEVDSIYVRELRDYRFLLPATQRSLARINSEIARIKQESTADDSIVNLALLSAQTLGEAAEQEKSLLNEDLQSFSSERSTLAAHLADLQQRWKDAKAEMSRFYRENNKLAAKWAQVQQAAADKVNDAPSSDAASNRKPIELSRAR